MAAFLGDLMLSFHRVFVFHATDSGPVPLSNFLTHYNISQRNHSVTMVVGCLWEMSKKFADDLSAVWRALGIFPLEHLLLGSWIVSPGHHRFWNLSAYGVHDLLHSSPRIVLIGLILRFFLADSLPSVLSAQDDMTETRLSGKRCFWTERRGDIIVYGAIVILGKHAVFCMGFRLRVLPRLATRGHLVCL